MDGSQQPAKQFGPIRNFIWPIHGYELRKLVPMLLIFFFILFNYNVLRTMKDTLVVTAESSGAEAIPFIKFWFMFPGSVLMAYIFTRLSNRVSREQVFYILTGGFILYFALFAFVLYPNRDTFHPHEFADTMQGILPLGLKGLIASFRNWTFTTFYVMSELWSSIIVSTLWWGIANQVTRLGEAKRFYGIFGVAINFSGVISGELSIWVCNMNYNAALPFGTDAWEQAMLILIGLVVLSGIIAMLLFRWMNKNVLSDPVYYDPWEAVKEEKVKGKLTLRDSFRYLLTSRYMTCIVVIVIAYNVVINLVEVVWKNEVHSLYSNPREYNLYMNQVTSIIGVIATLTSLFISGNSIRRLGWSFTAMLTPFILLFTSVAFFGTFLLKEYHPEWLMTFFGVMPLTVVVFFGSLQNVLSRAAKYTVYDATREMAFVPLSPEDKLKGKAVIDGVCSRLGKSGGSVIHQALLLVFASVTQSTPYVGLCLISVIMVWMGATQMLGKEFAALTTPGTEPVPHDNEELQNQPV